MDWELWLCVRLQGCWISTLCDPLVREWRFPLVWAQTAANASSCQPYFSQHPAHPSKPISPSPNLLHQLLHTLSTASHSLYSSFHFIFTLILNTRFILWAVFYCRWIISVPQQTEPLISRILYSHQELSRLSSLKWFWDSWNYRPLWIFLSWKANFIIQGKPWVALYVLVNLVYVVKGMTFKQ